MNNIGSADSFGSDWSLTVLETDFVWQYEICVAFWKSLFLMQFKAHLWYMWRLGDSDCFCFRDDQILCVFSYESNESLEWRPEWMFPFTIMCHPLVCLCMYSLSVWQHNCRFPATMNFSAHPHWICWLPLNKTAQWHLGGTKRGLFVLTTC